MKRILVTYYSRGGTTTQVATELAAALGADTDPIRDVVNREGALGFVRSGIEALTRGVPTIRTRLNPRDYELVVLGTPVWVGSMSSPMRSFLFENAASLPRVGCFCTMAGHGDQTTLQEMLAFCRAPSVPTFSSAEADVRAGRHGPRLEEFVRQLEQLMSGARAAA